MDRATLQRARRLYDQAPWGDRLHLAIRMAICPFERLAPFIPAEGWVLDLGCGHGLLANAIALDGPARRVVGVDPAARKLRTARATGAATGRVCFVQGDAVHNPVVGPCQAILIVDVDYLLTPRQQEEVLRACYDRLTPGGVLILKTMDVRPRWKLTLNRVEEWLAVRVLRITLGRERAFTFRPLEEWVALFEEIGFRTQALRLDRGYVHPHAAVIGVRP